jgi:dCMP deaminase
MSTYRQIYSNSKEKDLFKDEINFLRIAKNVADFSHAKRLKVGAVIVSSRGRIVGTGFNGTPSGVENVCEDSNNKTHEYVIHAELNAILNSTSSDLRGCRMFLTHSPCVKCAAALIQVGIKSVVYKDEYRITDGIKLLLANSIDVVHLDADHQILP